MDSEAKKCCILVVIISIIFGAFFAVVNFQDTNAMVKMISKGVDPLDARCAIEGEVHTPMCIIRAATKNKN